MKNFGIKTIKANRNKCCKFWKNIYFVYGNIVDGGWEVYRCKVCYKLIMCNINIERDFTNCREVEVGR